MVFRIGQDNTEVFTVETNVNREVSLSNDGVVSGSLYVIPRKLPGLKDIYPTTKASMSFASDTNPTYELQTIIRTPGGVPDPAGLLTAYMQKIHALASSAKFNSTASIYSFKTPTVYNQDAARRFLVQRLLEKNPVKYSQEADWSTTNYNCLNFFTSSETSTDSVLIYQNKLIIKPEFAGSDFSLTKSVINNPISGSSLSASLATSYQLYDEYTIDFWIKPKYNADASSLWGMSETPYYRPGTIMHMSSAYAITLHSGSEKDPSGYPNEFKVCFRLGTDAEILPDNILYNTDNFGTQTAATFWLSNSIPKDEWTHIAITYGGYKNNQGTGSLWVNGKKDKDIAIGNFISLGTCSSLTEPELPLYIGNFYEGIPQQTFHDPLVTSSLYNQNRFYSKQNGGLFAGKGPGDYERHDLYQELYFKRNGISDILGSTEKFAHKNYYSQFGFAYTAGPNYTDVFPWDAPLSHSFRYPLNAEIHDIRIWSKNLSADKIKQALTKSSQVEDIESLRFWVPPFFVEESLPRYNEPITPFYSFGSAGDFFAVSSSVPISCRMAMSVNGFYPNLENYVTDLATDTPPVLWGLRWAQQATGSTPDYTANRWLYEELARRQDIKKRLYTVLPCDHGGYQPSFGMIETLNFSTKSFVNDFDSKTLGRINLKNLMYYSEYTVDQVSNGVDKNTSIVGLSSTLMSTRNAEKFLLAQNDNITSSLVNDIVKARPEKTTAPASFGYSVWQRLQSADSHFITLFDISNLYYGESIKPGTLELYTNYMSGSDGAFGIHLKDNGRGGLYRADTSSQPAEWSTVGTVMYDDGVVIIKNPQLYFFENMGWTIKFKGTRHVYVYSIETAALPMTCTESPDPNNKNVNLPNKVDFDPSEEDRKQVFIGSVLIHDENMNVIMRTNLAQPVVKRSGDKLVFKTKIDY